MDYLISWLIDFLVSALRDSTKKKEQKPPDASSGSPQNPPPVVQPGPTRSTTPQRKAVSWEDELRRLLGDEAPVKPAPAKPPTITPRIITPTPPPIPVSRPAKPPPMVVRSNVSDVVPLPVPSIERISTGEMGKLDESRRAYERASNLDELAAARIKKAPGQHVGTTSVVFHTSTLPEVAQAISLVKNARTVRTALIASIILGPPKALERA
jgi:hypothetical protein